MNPQNGLKIKPFKNATSTGHEDAELVYLEQYLLKIKDLESFGALKHSVRLFSSTISHEALAQIHEAVKLSLLIALKNGNRGVDEGDNVWRRVFARSRHVCKRRIQLFADQIQNFSD